MMNSVIWKPLEIFEVFGCKSTLWDVLQNNYENQKTQYKIIKNAKRNRYKRTSEQLHPKPL